MIYINLFSPLRRVYSTQYAAKKKGSVTSKIKKVYIRYINSWALKYKI